MSDEPHIDRMRGDRSALHDPPDADVAEKAVLTATGDGFIMTVNHGAETMFGYSPYEMVGRHVAMLAAASDRDGVVAFYAWLRSQKDHLPIDVVREVARQRSDGTLFPTATHIMADVVGEQLVVTVVCRDLTQQRATQQALRESEENLRALMNAPTDAAVLVDPAGTIIALNSTAAARLGNYATRAHESNRNPGSLIGACIYDLFPPEVREHRRVRNQDVLRTGSRASYEDERDGQWTHNTIDPIVDGDGTVVRLAVFSRDITERKRNDERLRSYAADLEAANRHLSETMGDLARSQEELADKSAELERTLVSERDSARHDALTRSLNHGAIMESLLEAIGTQEQFAVAMVDVDGMKAANDTFGHQLGDAVLIAVAKGVMRAGAIVGRYGGDEFVAILLGADSDAARRFRDEVYSSFRDMSVTDGATGATFPVEASVGIALFPGGGRDVKELLDVADAAMYVEKRTRRSAGSARYSGARRADDRAASIMADLLPTLTSAESLEEKLGRMSHRLAMVGGYDAVNFDIYEEDRSEVRTQKAFAKTPSDLLEAWDREQRQISAHPLGPILEATRQPIILDDVRNDERLTTMQRTLLVNAGIRSGLVVPMIWQEAIVGLISVGSRRAAAFSAEDGRLLAGLAGQVVSLVRMAQQMDQLMERVAFLEQEVNLGQAA